MNRNDAHIITVGDEIVTGHTTDTNSAFIARALTETGITVAGKSSVGDDVEAMEELFRTSTKRHALVIVTGGLGPTDDDLTKRAIVKTFRRNLIFHEEILSEIQERFRRRGMTMPPINQNQALLPQGAIIFPNALGSAVGIGIKDEGKLLIALPGVPFEMKHLMTEQIIPYLKQNNYARPMVIRKLRTCGLIESRLAEQIGPGLSIPSGVRFAYLPHLGGVDLRILSEAITIEEAHRKADEVAHYVRGKLRDAIYAEGEKSLEAVVGELLQERKLSVAVAESCTGGLLGAHLTDTPGSSHYFRGGAIVYANEAKIALVKVESSTLAQEGAVSHQVACQMARGVREAFGTDLGISITGIAGPDGGTADKPVGLVYVGIASDRRVDADRFQFGADRMSIRERSVAAALTLLRKELLARPLP